MRATTGVSSRRRHKRIIKAAKGYRSIGKRFKTAKQAVMKAGLNAYRGRKELKRTMRGLWILRISNALKAMGINYSTFMNNVSKSGVILNRKMISEIAVRDAEGFEALVAMVGGAKAEKPKKVAKPKTEEVAEVKAEETKVAVEEKEVVPV